MKKNNKNNEIEKDREREREKERERDKERNKDKNLNNASDSSPSNRSDNDTFDFIKNTIIDSNIDINTPRDENEENDDISVRTTSSTVNGSNSSKNNITSIEECGGLQVIKITDQQVKPNPLPARSMNLICLFLLSFILPYLISSCLTAVVLYCIVLY